MCIFDGNFIFISSPPKFWISSEFVFETFTFYWLILNIYVRICKLSTARHSNVIKFHNEKKGFHKFLDRTTIFICISNAEWMNFKIHRNYLNSTKYFIINLWKQQLYCYILFSIFTLFSTNKRMCLPCLSVKHVFLFI